MSDDALGQILDAFAAMMGTVPQIAAEPVFTDRPPDDAIDAEEMPCWVIYAEAWDYDDAFMQGQTRHDALINFERLESSAHVGLVSRANRNAIAHLIAGISADPTLGGRLEECRPLNVAPPMDNGKSIGGASLQVAIRFHTPLGDHFTIVS